MNRNVSKLEHYMHLTLLLDLDDTLLETNTQAFLEAYYAALANHLSPLVPRDRMLAALMAGVRSMVDNADPGRTLQDAFEATFYTMLAAPKAALADSIRVFYDEVYPGLSRLTRRADGAQNLVEWAKNQGHRIALATDPLFPRQATLERVRWAGLDPDAFDLISSFESFHFTKLQPAFYAEFIGRLGWPETPLLMVGNDIERDLKPAQVLGLPTFHVDGARLAPVPGLPSGAGFPQRGAGDLVALRHWLESEPFEAFSPPLKSRDAILAALLATPAVLQSLTAGLSGSIWKEEPSPRDWALIELVCHLRDTEREVHHLQIDKLVDEEDPFVPRPDAAVWAKQRRYLKEDGDRALREFTTARLETLRRLQAAAATVWLKPARHAIFGRTSFLEVMGFMADHDRMHLQQASNTLSALRERAHRN
jgi:FMN phosphatase YigB (HAD superfamily)